MANPEETREHEATVAVARINARQIITVTMITAIAGIAGAVIQSVLSPGPSSSGSGHDTAAMPH